MHRLLRLYPLSRQNIWKQKYTQRQQPFPSLALILFHVLQKINLLSSRVCVYTCACVCVCTCVHAPTDVAVFLYRNPPYVLRQGLSLKHRSSLAGWTMNSSDLPVFPHHSPNTGIKDLDSYTLLFFLKKLLLLFLVWVLGISGVHSKPFIHRAVSSALVFKLIDQTSMPLS